MKLPLRGILLGVIASQLACTLLVDFNECVSDGDCSVTGVCVDAICQEAPRVSITDHVVEDTTWRANRVYVLENMTFVVPPATLTIEPGTIILGRRQTGLVSLAGARLVAEGTRDKPIVFTSDKPKGQRLAGDWAGLAMVGRAPTNRENFSLRIITDVHDTRVGGDVENWNCGTLRYVRVEFGGAEVDGQKALKGITLAGCGSDTTIEYVQTHYSDDDGVGVFGGNVDLRYVVSTRARDDAFDFDTGWRGTAQFLAIQQDTLAAEGLEIENLSEEPTALPETYAQIYNFTLIGANRAEGDRQLGLYFKLGGKGLLSHGIVTGYKDAGLFIEGPESAAHTTKGDVVVKDTLFYNIGDRGTGYFQLIDEEEGGFSDYSIFEDAETGNVFGADPGLQDPFNLAAPGWIPSQVNTTGVEPPPAGFDPTAVYRGAFSPSANAQWTDGWTSYPLN